MGGWAPPKPRMSVSDYAAAMVRRASRSEAFDPAAAGAALAASPAVASGDGAWQQPQQHLSTASRRQTVDAAVAGGGGAAAGATRAAGSRGLVQRLRPPPVDSLSLLEIQLDGGRPIKLETLLELKPWEQIRLLRQQRAAAAVSASGSGGAASGGASSAGGIVPAPPVSGVAPSGAVPAGAVPGSGSAAASGGAGSKKKPKGPRLYQRVSFTVKAAAVVSAEEPRLLPDTLLLWAVKVGLRWVIQLAVQES